jgi:hypothetical protein
MAQGDGFTSIIRPRTFAYIHYKTTARTVSTTFEEFFNFLTQGEANGGSARHILPQKTASISRTEPNPRASLKTVTTRQCQYLVGEDEGWPN